MTKHCHHHHHPSRRGLLGGLLGGAALFGGLRSINQLALANTLAGASDRYFIFCYFQGGWDALLGLDPRDPQVFRPDLQSETLIQPGYNFLADIGAASEIVSSGIPGMDFGPFIGNLADWSSRMAVVRGMSMDTLSHEAGRRRFLTGKVPAGVQARGSNGATHLASWLGQNDPIPNLSAKVESYNVDQPVYATALGVNNVADLQDILAPGDAALPGEVSDRISALLDEFASCEKTKESRVLTEALEQRLAAQSLVAQRLDLLFDFASNDADMVAIRDQYGFGTNELGSSEAQAAMAVTALTAGVSRVVSFEATGNLDTHDNWAVDHGPRLRDGFDLVAKLVADLDSRPYGNTGETWLDRTTIMGFSEFTRTPLLNDRGGRDHALMNNCFVLGGGIQGGQVIGASSDVGMAPQAVDLNTGVLNAGGDIVRPEHIWRALLHSIDVVDDVADLRVEPLLALLA